jgi:hypothetical protein
MPDLTVVIANEILKLDYIEVIRDVLNSSTVLNHRLEKDFESVQGDQVYIGLNKTRNPSFAARPISGTGGDWTVGSTTLPARGQQGYDATTFPIKEMYGRLIVAERDIKASRNSKGALIRVLDAEMRHLIRDSKNTVNKYNYLDGTANFSKVLTDDTGGGPSVITVYNGVEDADTVGEVLGGIRHMEVGMVIADYSDKVGGTTGQVLTASAITAVDYVNNTFTVAEDADLLVADHYIAVPGTVGFAQMGLMGIVDDGTIVPSYNGITRSGNSWWQGNVLGNSGTGRDVTLDLLQQAIDTSEVEGDGEVTCFLTTYEIRRKILALLVADKRFVAPYEMDLDGGFRALSYNGIPIIPDRHAPPSVIWALDEPSIRFYQMSDWEWMEEDGAVLNRVPNEPYYEATLFLYREMASADPRNNVRIDDILS